MSMSFRRALMPFTSSGVRPSSPTILPISSEPSPSLSDSPPASISTSSRRRPRSNRSQSGPLKFTTSLKLPLVLRRLLKPPTLDFETAIWEICYLFIAPKKVYRQIYYHRQTKNTWARDDPSFALLLSLFLILSALAWGIAYSPGFVPIIKLMFNMVFIDFLVSGIIAASVGWYIASRFLRQKTGRNSLSISQQDNNVEWGYCFDVHCNSFLVIWFWLYVVQFIMLPIIIKDSWISLFLGNLLYLCAFSYYVVITFLGYSALPFLENTEFILSPILLFVVLFVISLFGFNIPKHTVHLYFGS
ncbi:UNC-50 family-domain-containing protein [Dipodascopsis uninucleata]